MSLISGSNMDNMLAGSSSLLNNFNNGQRTGKSSQPLYWKFNDILSAPTWQYYNNLTSGNSLNYNGP